MTDDRGEFLGQMHGVFSNFTPVERRWTVEEVENRLTEAARNHERVIGKVGPSQKLTFWIDWRLFRNMDSFDRNAQAEGIREKTREPDRHTGTGTSLEISRILDSLEWPMKYLRQHDDERAIISIWFWCKARHEPFSRWHRQACGCRRTAYRLRTRGFEIIAEGLLRDRISP